jgi:ATP sulfurylase
MSNSVKGFIVALQHDMKDEDVEKVVNAIGMIKGVIQVIPIETTIADHINRAQIRWELKSKLIQILTND